MLGIPLGQCCPSADPPLITSMIPHVLDWTGGKPYYVHAVGSRIAVLQYFREQWPQEITRQVYEDVAPQLADFYNLGNAVAKNILGLLAHQPGLTVPGIARRLSVSRQTVWNCVDDLVALDKVRMAGGEYHIVGTLIADWGKRHHDLPVPRPWPQRLRWAGTAMALAAAFWMFWYTHPPTHVAQFAFSEGTLRLAFPASVEAEEQGTLVVAVRNTGKTALSEVHVNLFAERIDFQKESSSHIAMYLSKSNFIFPCSAPTNGQERTMKKHMLKYILRTWGVAKPNTSLSPTVCMPVQRQEQCPSRSLCNAPSEPCLRSMPRYGISVHGL